MLRQYMNGCIFRVKLQLHNDTQFTSITPLVWLSETKVQKYIFFKKKKKSI